MQQRNITFNVLRVLKFCRWDEFSLFERKKSYVVWCGECSAYCTSKILSCTCEILCRTCKILRCTCCLSCKILCYTCKIVLAALAKSCVVLAACLVKSCATLAKSCTALVKSCVLPKYIIRKYLDCLIKLSMIVRIKKPPKVNKTEQTLKQKRPIKIFYRLNLFQLSRQMVGL